MVGTGVFVPPSLQELEELLRAAFLEETHQRALKGFYLRARDLGYPAVTIYEASRDLLELEIASDIGVHEDLRKFSRGDDELRHKIDSVVSVAPELRGRSLIRTEFAIKLRTAWSVS